MSFLRSSESIKVVFGIAVGVGIGAASMIFLRRNKLAIKPLPSPFKRLNQKNEKKNTSSRADTQGKDKVNLEEQALLEGGPRVKFKANWLGTIDSFFKDKPQMKTAYEEICNQLADQMLEMEKLGVTPIAPDGKVGGNCSAILRNEQCSRLIVSKSGKAPHKKMDIYSDFVIIESFDSSDWSCQYYAQSDDVLPTSDAPLHYAILYKTRDDLQWSKYPQVVLHGHAFETEKEANERNYPISTEETLFSTKEDTEALMGLLKKYPYSEDNIFIRKGHGFVLLAESVPDSVNIFDKRMRPYLEK